MWRHCQPSRQPSIQPDRLALVHHEIRTRSPLRVELRYIGTCISGEETVNIAVPSKSASVNVQTLTSEHQRTPPSRERNGTRNHNGSYMAKECKIAVRQHVQNSQLTSESQRTNRDAHQRQLGPTWRVKELFDKTFKLHNSPVNHSEDAHPSSQWQLGPTECKRAVRQQVQNSQLTTAKEPGRTSVLLTAAGSYMTKRV